MMMCCIGRRVRASMRLTEAAKALATRDHVGGISGLPAPSNNYHCPLFFGSAFTDLLISVAHAVGWTTNLSTSSNLEVQGQI